MNIYMRILLLFAMIFVHIFDDFHQGILAEMKQKKYWIENAPKGRPNIYKNDYIVCLFVHSFKWAFSIMFIPTMYFLVMTDFELELAPFVCILVIFIFNLVVHFVVDDAKANKYKINLVVDQFIHFLQILLTWIAMVQ